MKNNHFYILTGPSGCGKTTLLNLLYDSDNRIKYQISKIKKYSTRERRDDNDDVFQIFNSNKIPEIKKGQRICFEHDNSQIDFGENGVEILYASNKNIYTINKQDIDSSLSNGQNPFVIISDFRVIKQLKKLYSDKVKVIYIASSIDEIKLEVEQTKRHNIPEKIKTKLISIISKLNSAVNLSAWEHVAEKIITLNNFWNKNKPGGESTDIRKEKIKNFHMKYIENIELFDHVILNYAFQRQEYMLDQILSLLSDSNKIESKITPPLFVICAASKSGKGSLLKMIKDIQPNNCIPISKILKREPKLNDKDDGSILISSKNKNFNNTTLPEWWSKSMISRACKNFVPDEYDFKWRYHTTQVPLLLNPGSYKQCIEYLSNDYENKRIFEKCFYYNSKNDHFNLINNITSEQIIRLIFIFNLLKNGTIWKNDEKDGVDYAISTKEINMNIKDNHPQIVISNMDQIKIFKEKYPQNIVLIYIFRLFGSEDNRFNKSAENQLDFNRSCENISTYLEYTENISQFDHVLLNTTRIIDLFEQMFNLIEYYSFENFK